ncbi:hypothetical protein [Paenibacillus radicis (ex Xue et al. 2023)]|uniref:Uncharacterized protein n=1 Tax=Paenibacillus radicis (ex Xue et al. 2023) TaxID=2972489 RepID=A0ABT1YK19_9BACL|nr:hypothetical protein [Paenibacillus radicis (ex Xue et al. 2023)]MCR8633511.1 hypothetical protein [Paenibacillus radicis (ex Xue et al. 2023)]
MNVLLNTFLTIMKELESSEVGYKEDSELFTVNYKTHIDTIKKLAANYEAVFHNYQISFEVICEGKMGFENFKLASRLLKPAEDISLTLTINKKQQLKLDENTFVFFKLESFQKIFNTFNTGFNKGIDTSKAIHFHLTVDKNYYNPYVKLYRIEDGVIHPAIVLDDNNIKEQDRVLKIREETSRSMTNYFIPDFYEIEGLCGALKPWFEQNLFHASLIYLSNKITAENQITIRGNKNVELIFSQDFIVMNAAVIYRIFKFSFEDKHYNDKIEISRNILTIYLNTSDNTKKLDELLPKIEKTISSHFTAYIQDSIKKFFNDRKEVIKEAHKFASDLKSEAEKLLTYINTSLIGIITAIFSGALGLSKGERWFLLVAFALHLLVFLLSYLFNRGYVKRRMKETLDLYDQYIEKFVILAQDDLDDIKRIYINPSKLTIESYLRKYFWVIAGLIVLMCALIILGVKLPDTFFEITPPSIKTNPTP